MSPELDTVLPGNDGQIWKELVELHGDDPGMFNTTKDVTVKHVVQALKVKIWQAARLITLWRKKVWREILTEWVATGLGYETFNLSTFSWMAALRLDEVRQKGHSEGRRALTAGAIWRGCRLCCGRLGPRWRS